MYPRIEINLKNIVENAKKVKKLCEKQEVSLSLVVKILADSKEIVQTLVENGVDCICDSRIINLISYQDIPAEKWLIRIPMLSEVAEVVKYADVSLNSEMQVIRKLNEEAKKQKKKHKVILMYELGDLREGCLKEELEENLKESMKLDNIEVYGIGINLSCYGEIVPTEENMSELEEIVEELETKYQIRFKVISGGSSSSYNMLKEGKLPKKVNNLRLGESVFLGNVPCFEEEIEELNKNNFLLKAEIIELKEKPSIPRGKRGKSNSFGENITFIDKGIRKRAIVGLGKQDVRVECLTPVDESIMILDGSSDHILLDVSDSSKNYQVGDIIEFKMNYAGILTAMTSKYVERKIVR